MQSSDKTCREIAKSYSVVIPGLAKREPGIHQAAEQVVTWIPGLRQVAHPGMTRWKTQCPSNDIRNG
jgi:hypothetical protein